MKKVIFDEQKVAKYKHRDCFQEVIDFIENESERYGCIAALCGLKGTGKSVLLQQLQLKYGKERCRLYAAEETDTMDDVYNQIDQNVKKGSDIFLIDDITCVSDFISNSFLLKDCYSWCAAIIIAGDDSLCMELAMCDELLFTVKQVRTSYISYAEHARVLGDCDTDSYIMHGGFMGDVDIGGIESVGRYLDESVAGNIVRSMARNHRCAYYASLQGYDLQEMQHAVRKLTGLYSGAASEDAGAYPSRDALPIDSLRILSPHMEPRNRLNGAYADAINSECMAGAMVSARIVDDICLVLRDVNFLDTVEAVTIGKDDNGEPIYLSECEYHVVQPAVKYRCLIDGMEEFSRESKDTAVAGIEQNVWDDMLVMVVMYDVLQALPKERYSVRKLLYRNCGCTKKAYDLVVYDKSRLGYYAFFISHQAISGDNLDDAVDKCGTDFYYTDANFVERMDWTHGDRIYEAILHTGDTIWGSAADVDRINVTDFLMAVAGTKNMSDALSKLKK